jgi:serine/threonine protein kinase
MNETNTMSQFPEEQLDSSVGYFAAQLGQTLQNSRWSIIRKLGWGPRSSTWLAVDSNVPDNITAVKIFTVAATVDPYTSNELDMLRGPLSGPTLPFPSIRGHFYEQSPKGKHLCLVLNVLGPSVESFRPGNDNGACLPLHVVKKIVADIVEALCELQKKNIIHGGEFFTLLPVFSNF